MSISWVIWSVNQNLLSFFSAHLFSYESLNSVLDTSFKLFIIQYNTSYFLFFKCSLRFSEKKSDNILYNLCTVYCSITLISQFSLNHMIHHILGIFPRKTIRRFQVCLYTLKYNIVNVVLCFTSMLIKYHLTQHSSIFST